MHFYINEQIRLVEKTKIFFFKDFTFKVKYVKLQYNYAACNFFKTTFANIF